MRGKSDLVERHVSRKSHKNTEVCHQGQQPRPSSVGRSFSVLAVKHRISEPGSLPNNDGVTASNPSDNQSVRNPILTLFAKYTQL